LQVCPYSNIIIFRIRDTLKYVNIIFHFLILLPRFVFDYAGQSSPNHFWLARRSPFLGNAGDVFIFRNVFL
jgi:hypothetical protein